MGNVLSKYLSAMAEQTNAECVIDIPARAGHYIVVTHVSGGYDDRAITQPARVEAPVATVKWKYPIHGADGVVVRLVYGPGQAVRVALPAGGAGKIGYLNCTYYYSTERESGA